MKNTTIRDKELMDMLKKRGALLAGHFGLSSGLHSDIYFQYALVLQHPEDAARLGELIAEKFMNKGITCVAGPALGGIIIAHEVAKALKTRCIFGERDKQDDRMVIRRFNLTPQDKVLIVEDVITTGKSIRELINAVKKSGAEIIGIGALADRSSQKIDFGYYTEALIKLHVKTFNPDECPLCKKNIPLTKPGSRKG